MAWDDGALCHRDMRIRSRCGDILQSRFTTKQTIVSLSSSIKANQGCVLNTRSHDVSHSPSSSSTRLSSWLVNYCPTTPVQTSAGEANTGRQIRTKRATQYHLSHACTSLCMWSDCMLSLCVAGPRAPPSAICPTPAKQNDGGCDIVPRLHEFVYVKWLYVKFVCGKFPRVDKVFVDKVFVDKVCVDKVFVDKVFVDKVFVDKVCVDKVFVDKVFVDKVCVDKVCVDKVCMDKVCVDKEIVDNECERVCVSKLFMDELCLWVRCVGVRVCVCVCASMCVCGVRPRSKMPHARKCGEGQSMRDHWLCVRKRTAQTITKTNGPRLAFGGCVRVCACVCVCMCVCLCVCVYVCVCVRMSAWTMYAMRSVPGR